jgi:xylulokinase
MKYLLGYDIGSSSVKAALIEAETGRTVATATSPSVEMSMQSSQIGWAEQDPEMWWQEAINASKVLRGRFDFDKNDVGGIGISYQMHGLVLVDKDQKVLRPSIIWCDSRAVNIGNHTFLDLGESYCLEHYLNAPGNFTASKLRWVIENEPEIWAKTDKMMLPGDFLAMKMSGEVQTTVSGLSEGIFWDFKEKKIAHRLLEKYEIRESVIPPIVDTFSKQSFLNKQSAELLGLSEGMPIAYRAGDQPNNAFSLNVLNAGEVAATAGTSGVVYGINDAARYDDKSRVNSFVHVNNTEGVTRNGVLLCINGTGILNSWLRRIVGNFDYEQMNTEGVKTPIGADGLIFVPFGNGAERILENRPSSATMKGLNFNTHGQGHLFRAAQEGIVYALNYGLGIMKDMGVAVNTVRAGNANMFLSPLFREAFANTTGATIELYDTDGAAGAARGAGVGVGYYSSFSEAFVGLNKIKTVEPQADLQAQYQEVYEKWLQNVAADLSAE